MRETCFDPPRSARPVHAHPAASRTPAAGVECLWLVARAVTFAAALLSAPAASAQADDAGAGSFPSGSLRAPDPEGRPSDRAIKEEDQDLAPEDIPPPPDKTPDKTLAPGHKKQLGKRAPDSLAPPGGWAWERSGEGAGERSGDTSSRPADKDR